jgi:hypothetical protein
VLIIRGATDRACLAHDRRLLVTAVNAAAGELRVFDRDSGVDLVDAW